MLQHLIKKSQPTTTATCIFLHGLGDSGHGWVPVAEMWAQKLPHIQFILPHAPVQSVTLNMGMQMPAWYDIYSLSKLGREDERGIMNSLAQIDALIENEISRGVPAERIVVGGFSQGGAMSLVTGMLSKHRIAGVVCMSGYLPLKEAVKSIKNGNEIVPVWMGHGKVDEVVAFEWAEKSRDLLKGEGGIAVEFYEFNGLGHGANEDEIRMAGEFLDKVLPHK